MAKRVSSVPIPPSKGPVSSEPSRFRLKWLISAAIAFHLWAILAEPLRFQTRGPLGPSPATNLAYLPVGFYAEFMYLTHGYAFFAPDPGPSHLIKAKTSHADGTVTERLYPNLLLDRPRLKYHRHFMLAEFFNNLYRPSAHDGTPAEREAIAQERKVFLQLEASFRNHLAQGSDLANVELIRLEHRLPWINEVQSGLKLDDRSLYQEMTERELKPPLPPEMNYFDRAWPKR